MPVEYDFFGTQHGGQAKRDFGEGDVVQHVGALERLDEQKPERGGPLRHRVGGQFSHAEQVSLELADVLESELVGPARLHGGTLQRFPESN